MKSKSAKIPYRIGDRVRITHLTTLHYDEDGNRVPVESGIMDFEAVVVGAVNRPLGKYHKGHNYSTWDGDGDCDPPYLEVKGTILLIQCKTRLFGKFVEAQLDHISKVEE